MKKVLVLAAAAALFATPALASIVNTAHDLTLIDNSAGGQTEVCVYCHTPHGADTTVANAPLWNRSTVDLSATSPYLGFDLQADDGGALDYNDTDAELCLSCHDGTIAETLQNEPNLLATDVAGYTFVSAPAVMGSDMSDDHPIGFDYTLVSAADAGSDQEIYGKAAVELKTGMARALSYGNGNEMWCSSCHDVHDTALDNGSFLRINNAGSNLCLACHNK